MRDSYFEGKRGDGEILVESSHEVFDFWGSDSTAVRELYVLVACPKGGRVACFLNCKCNRTTAAILFCAAVDVVLGD